MEFDVREMALMVIRRFFQSKHGMGGVIEYGLNATIDSVARLLMGLSNDEGVWLFLTITLSETVRQRKPGATDQSINLHISNRLYEVSTLSLHPCIYINPAVLWYRLSKPIYVTDTMRICLQILLMV